MDSQHRKIELQSPADLTYLTTRLRTAARQKLDLHLPPVSDTTEPDELRKHVEQLVDEFVAQVLLGMRANVGINGMDVVERSREGVEEGLEGLGGVGGAGGVGEGEGEVERVEYEPFDDKLRQQLGSTVAKRDALISQISRHRRATPGMAAENFKARFLGDNEALLAQNAPHVVGEGVGGVGKDAIADMESLTRQEEVQRNWTRALEGLGRLNDGVTETRARLERVKGVVGHLGGEEKSNA